VTLLRPPSNFGELDLKVKELAVKKLKRIGRHDSGEPYFGKWASSRFDSPDKKYGTLYCGQTLDAAMAETILHDEIPVDGAFPIRAEEFEKRFLVTYDGATGQGDLRMADLTGASLKRLGVTTTFLPRRPTPLPRSGALQFMHIPKMSTD